MAINHLHSSSDIRRRHIWHREVPKILTILTLEKKIDVKKNSEEIYSLYCSLYVFTVQQEIFNSNRGDITIHKKI
jgi:hypothetical protein